MDEDQDKVDHYHERCTIPITPCEFIVSMLLFGFVCLGLGYWWSFHHSSVSFNKAVVHLQEKHKSLVMEHINLDTRLGVIEGKGKYKPGVKGLPSAPE